MNLPEGAFFERNNPINQKNGCAEIPAICPECGGHITEFIYSYECDDCWWSEEKIVYEY